jgi:hypothetical protein
LDVEEVEKRTDFIKRPDNVDVREIFDADAYSCNWADVWVIERPN